MLKIGEQVVLEDWDGLYGEIVGFTVITDDDWTDVYYIVRLDDGLWVKDDVMFVRYLIVYPNNVRRVSPAEVIE